MPTKKVLPATQRNTLLEILETRFEKNAHRHKGISWLEVKNRLLAQPKKLWTLDAMEETGGEPDVVGQDKKTGEFLFYDCSPESPKGRRSCCYDRAGWESRKEHRPDTTAIDMAAEMGVELLTESEYRDLQKLGTFDSKTSSWLKTPEDIRKLGGAIFGDFRYKTVFIYHNGAQSYYSGRGFRGVLRL